MVTVRKVKTIPAELLVDHPTFAQLFQQFYQERRTGTFTVHLLHGVPTYIDVPSAPQRISLDRGKK